MPHVRTFTSKLDGAGSPASVGSLPVATLPTTGE